MWRGTDKYGGKCCFACEKSLCQLTLELCTLTFAGLEVLKMWRLTMADNHTDQSTEVARARKTKISQESHIIDSACRSCVNSVKKVHECPGTYVSHRAAVAIFLRSDSLGLVPKNMRCSFKNTSCMHPQPQYFNFFKKHFFQHPWRVVPTKVYLFLSWLAVSRVDAGSGCNEAADEAQHTFCILFFMFSLTGCTDLQAAFSLFGYIGILTL